MQTDDALSVLQILQYNVPGGKKTRALTLVYAYKVLTPSDQLTEENIRLARILAWCLELVRKFVLLFFTFYSFYS